MEIVKQIGDYCREHRLIVLNMSLSKMCEITNTNIKTLSAFEHGRSSNIDHLFKYYILTDESNRGKFITDLFKMVKV